MITKTINFVSNDVCTCYVNLYLSWRYSRFCFNACWQNVSGH